MNFSGESDPWRHFAPGVISSQFYLQKMFMNQFFQL